MHQLIGHQEKTNRLLEMYQQEKLPHALIFYGLEGIGKKKAAVELARQILSVHTALHPDLLVIEPEGKSLSVDVIRDIKNKLSRVLHSSKARFVIINDAHKMTPQAANSLLKTLEEPHSGNYFILITPSLFQMMPTIRSRCQRIYFNPPAEKLSAALLASELGIESEEALEMIRLSEGSIGKAQNLLGSAAAMSDWSNWLNKSVHTFQEGSELANKWLASDTDLKDILSLLLQKTYQDMLAGDSVQLLPRWEKIAQAVQDVQRNVNKQLVLENLFWNL